VPHQNTLELQAVGARAALVQIGQRTLHEKGLTDVYLRPPKAFFEPKSLAAVLRKRLAV
jgi:hypothetical protein